MENIIANKSFLFAVRTVKLCKYLQQSKKELVMSRQLLRAATSIGANVSEAQYAQSRGDFVAKLQIAMKEAGETDYWIRLLRETDYLSEKEYRSIITDCREVESILAAILKSSKK